MEFAIGPHGEFTGLKRAKDEIVNANYPQIRLLTVDHNPALKPISDIKTGGWQAVTADSVGSFSAVAYLFGCEIHARYKVPIGLIQSTFGGTPAEAWTSAEGLRSFPEFRHEIESISRVTDASARGYADYSVRLERWYQQHTADFYPSFSRQTAWADPSFDAGNWPTITEPRPDSARGKDFNGYNGAIWLRRVVTLTSKQATNPLLLHLGAVMADDTTYFNGKLVGSSSGRMEPREYLVPAGYLHAGPNLLAIHLIGLHDPIDPALQGVGLFGDSDSLWAEVNGGGVPLAGLWSYHPAVDLQGFPIGRPSEMKGRPDRNAPTELFNGMINPLVPFAIKGVIWYQGESNTQYPLQYRTLFPALIADWRHHWGYRFPFLFVQLAGFDPNKSESEASRWAELREAQAMTLAIPNTGMATAIDLGEAHDVHPKNKQDVAHRLALSAIKVAYGEDVVYTGPTYQSMVIEHNNIRVKFSNTAHGLQVKDSYGYLRGFEIATVDGDYTLARANLVGQDEVEVYAGTIKNPTNVRYDWKNMPDGNLYNSEGLPALPFKTDTISSN